MNIFQIISFVFKKFNISKETLNEILNLIINIPTYLKIGLVIALVSGAIYYGYQYIYGNEIEELEQELKTLEQDLNYVVNVKDYSNDIFYLIQAIKITEEILKYAYEEEQLLLNIMKNFVKKNHPGDAVLYDIDAMINRNKFLYDLYCSTFHKALSNCKYANAIDSLNHTEKIINK